MARPLDEHPVDLKGMSAERRAYEAFVIYGAEQVYRGGGEPITRLKDGRTQLKLRVLQPTRLRGPNPMPLSPKVRFHVWLDESVALRLIDAFGQRSVAEPLTIVLHSCRAFINTTTNRVVGYEAEGASMIQVGQMAPEPTELRRPKHRKGKVHALDLWLNSDDEQCSVMRLTPMESSKEDESRSDGRSLFRLGHVMRGKKIRNILSYWSLPSPTVWLTEEEAQSVVDAARRFGLSHPVEIKPRHVTLYAVESDRGFGEYDIAHTRLTGATVVERNPLDYVDQTPVPSGA